jgi:hypothetical protein
MDQAAYQRLPERLSLRQVEVAGRTLVTTLLDARAIKRRPKPHALLAVPRHLAREQIMRMRAAYASGSAMGF